MNRVGVVVVDDEAIFRGGVRGALEPDDALLVIGETAGEAGAVDKIAQVQADVVVVGVNPPAMQGVETLRELRRRLPRAALLALAAYPDAAGRNEALAAGATIYDAKSIDADDLRRLVHEALAAVRPYTPGDPARANGRNGGPGWRGAAPLSRRETQILHLVARGQSNKEIAAGLGISDQTVKNNITSLLRKLGVQDRTQAVIYALRQGWIDAAEDEPARDADEAESRR
ncbi:MAG: response regulator transcription factor [Thermomicrobiales bacterium]|nr:response regulator transcription factor [Thermomicrobiales bacterium]